MGVSTLRGRKTTPEKESKPRQDAVTAGTQEAERLYPAWGWLAKSERSLHMAQGPRRGKGALGELGFQRMLFMRREAQQKE